MVYTLIFNSSWHILAKHLFLCSGYKYFLLVLSLFAHSLFAFFQVSLQKNCCFYLSRFSLTVQSIWSPSLHLNNADAPSRVYCILRKVSVFWSHVPCISGSVSGGHFSLSIIRKWTWLDHLPHWVWCPSTCPLSCTETLSSWSLLRPLATAVF